MPVPITKYIFGGIVNYTSGTVVWNLSFDEQVAGIHPVLDTESLPPNKIGVIVTDPAHGGAVGEIHLTATVDGNVVDELTATISPPVLPPPTPGFEGYAGTRTVTLGQFTTFFGQDLAPPGATASAQFYPANDPLAACNYFKGAMSGAMVSSAKASFNAGQWGTSFTTGAIDYVGVSDSAQTATITTASGTAFGTFSPNNGTYNTTYGTAGHAYLYPGFTLTFSQAVSAVGMYFTNLRRNATPVSVVITFSDSSSISTTIPAASSSPESNLVFWGFVSPALTVTALSVTCANGLAGFGIDDLLIAHSGMLMNNAPLPQLVGPAPLPVHLLNTASGNVTSWQYDFTNNGSIDSTDKDPYYLYSDVGTYDVRQVVSDGTSSVSLTRHNYVHVAANFYGIVFDMNLRLITFEGLQSFESVDTYYNGGSGSLGSTSDTNLGVYFSGTTLALIDMDASGDGNTGNFANEPSPSTIMFFMDGDNAVLNVPGGFDTGFSFYYSSGTATTVTVYSELELAGSVLGTITLSAQGFDGRGGDPTGQFNNWTPVGVSFAGTAKSIDFRGTASQVGFDNITLGQSVPGTIVSPLVGEVPLVVNFYDDVPTATAWEWDIKNNGTINSTASAFQYVYTEPGTYSVKRVATTPSGTVTQIEQDYVIVSPTVCTIDPHRFSGTVLLCHGYSMTDHSGTGKTVTAISDAALKVGLGVYGPVYYGFNGTLDRLSVTNHADFDFGTGNFAVGFWVRKRSLSTSPYLIARRDGTNQGWYFYSGGSTSANTSGWGRNGPINDSHGVMTFELDVWYHVEVNRQDGVLYLFQQGVLRGQFADTADYTGVTSNLAIGSDWNGTGSLIGDMQEIYIVNGHSLHTSDFTPNPSPYCHN